MLLVNRFEPLCFKIRLRICDIGKPKDISFYFNSLEPWDVRSCSDAVNGHFLASSIRQSARVMPNSSLLLRLGLTRLSVGRVGVALLYRMLLEIVVVEMRSQRGSGGAWKKKEKRH